MKPKGPVLIVAPPGDAHALVVAGRIEARGHEAIIWDSARLPHTDRLTLHVSRTGSAAILESSACGTLNLGDLTSIWWRRPLAASIPSSVSDDFVRAYCRGESEQLLSGVLSGLAVPVYNNPDSEEAAARKPYQLKVAADVGLCVPRTVMTSSPEAIRALAAEGEPRGLVFKAFRSPVGSACATQRFLPSHLEQLELLDHAPVIFQDLVEPNVDIRASVIGGRIFAVESRSPRLDWRTDATVSWTHHELPEHIKEKVLTLMARLGLRLGHLDFRVDHGGRYVFFEVNPSGQFLFLEVDDERLQVTAALADYLLALT
jgi:MvdD pre-ATP grasp domain